MTAAFDAEMRKGGHFRVVIFGSARIHPESPYYQQINHLATLIAQEGWDVVTGGGPGLMEAAASGHRAGNLQRHAHSIGLPIILPAGERMNEHLDLKKEFHRFTARLDTFMTLSNCVVVAPGGVGTMLEFFYSWQLMQVGLTHQIPIILLGDMWPEFLVWVRKWQLHPGLLDQKDLDLLIPAKDLVQAMAIIRGAHARFKDGVTPPLPARRSLRGVLDG